ncbi:tetratricopeptide repeat protein [Chryseobacterium sp. JM1]|uniref:tetratricopeptide repeat protein n=1 Tax=Chryseobacterium sp. JM1 TaxID=1233950 RepID=UPI0004E74D3D|nr:tetratricopeptide repeat protein [Chryseobacterium sp. JM1]KFF20489.1 hypothetical protein IW22_12655 [Chryseobacterium sp. JM1]
MMARLVCIFLFACLSFASAQVNPGEVFPVATLTHEFTVPAKNLKEETVITRLLEIPRAALFKNKDWNESSSSFTSFEKIESVVIFQKINKTKDRNYNFSCAATIHYVKGAFQVELITHNFEKFLESDGKPNSFYDVKYLEYYQAMSQEFKSLIIKYLSGNTTAAENRDIQLNKAADLTSSGKSEDALKINNKILASDPQNSLALFNKAQLLFAKKKYAETLNTINLAEKNTELADFEILTYKNIKIQSLMATGQNQKALEETHKTVQLTAGIDPEKAFETIEDDNGKETLAPTDRTKLLLLSVFNYEQLKKNKEAVESLKKFEALIPNNDIGLLTKVFKFYCLLKSRENTERVRSIILKDSPKANLPCKN